MITKNDQFKCDECGKFINFNDPDVIVELITPSSEFSNETWDHICGRCARGEEHDAQIPF